jgi:hypothetical protein
MRYTQHLNLSQLEQNHHENVFVHSSSTRFPKIYLIALISVVSTRIWHSLRSLRLFNYDKSCSLYIIWHMFVGCVYAFVLHHLPPICPHYVCTYTSSFPAFSANRTFLSFCRHTFANAISFSSTLLFVSIHKRVAEKCLFWLCQQQNYII